MWAAWARALHRVLVSGCNVCVAGRGVAGQIFMRLSAWAAWPWALHRVYVTGCDVCVAWQGVADRVLCMCRYVGGLAPGVAEGDLRDQFYPFGEIRSIRVRLRCPCLSLSLCLSQFW